MKIKTENPDILLHRLPVGKLAANCYILADLPHKKAVVIDPGGDGDRILKVLKDNDLTVEMIIDTHGHWDHVGDNAVIQEATGASLYIHQADEGFLDEAGLNLSVHFGSATTCGKATHLLADGDVLTAGDLQIRVLHTPGHTPGGVCLLCGKLLFAGDTLFAGSMGRTDLAGGDPCAMEKSLKEVLMSLDDDIQVYPGHGPATTIGHERQVNPFCR